MSTRATWPTGLRCGAGLPRIDYVKVDPLSEPYVDALTGCSGSSPASTLDPKALERTINDYYGRGKLESLDYQVLTDGDQHGLLISAQPNSWGSDFVRFGLGLQDDFQGNATYNIGARLVMGDITQTGGEWVWDLQAGTSPHIYTELYLPFEQTSAYFIDPHTEFDDVNAPLVDSGPESSGRIPCAHLPQRSWISGRNWRTSGNCASASTTNRVAPRCW